MFFRLIKKNITEQQLKSIKRRLEFTTLSEYNPQTKKIKAYRETENFLYIPRNFDLENTFEQTTNEKPFYSVVPSSNGVVLNFHGRLYESQQLVSSNITNKLNETDISGIILALKTGGGKCHGRGTRILMSNGSSKNIEQIKIGDNVMGDDYTPRYIKGICSGYGYIYKIKYENTFFTTNADHILCLINDNLEIQEISVKAYIARQLQNKARTSCISTDL